MIEPAAGLKWVQNSRRYILAARAAHAFIAPAGAPVPDVPCTRLAAALARNYIQRMKVIIDLLAIEIEHQLPYWLSPEGRRQDMIAAIRAKHRAKYLAELKAKRRTT